MEEDTKSKLLLHYNRAVRMIVLLRLNIYESLYSK